MSFILLGILNSQAAGAVGAGSYDLLETTVLGSDTASVSFTGLGSYTDYKHLQIRMVARDDLASTFGLINATFNGDSGANYADHGLFGAGSSVSSNGLTSKSKLILGQITGANNTANAFGGAISDILDFANTGKNTTTKTLMGRSVGFNPRIALRSGLHLNTGAVTSIELTPEGSNFVTGSRFSLYGIKAA